MDAVRNLTGPGRIGVLPEIPPPPKAAPGATGASFADMLTAEHGISMSRHATQRIAQRQITFDSKAGDRLASALDQLASRGAKSAAVLLDSARFVVDVPSKTVLTALGPNEQEVVFTKIDSVFIG